MPDDEEQAGADASSASVDQASDTSESASNDEASIVANASSAASESASNALSVPVAALQQMTFDSPDRKLELFYAIDSQRVSVQRIVVKRKRGDTDAESRPKAMMRTETLETDGRVNASACLFVAMDVHVERTLQVNHLATQLLRGNPLGLPPPFVSGTTAIANHAMETAPAVGALAGPTAMATPDTALLPAWAVAKLKRFELKIVEHLSDLDGNPFVPCSAQAGAATLCGPFPHGLQRKRDDPQAIEALVVVENDIGITVRLVDADHVVRSGFLKGSSTENTIIETLREAVKSTQNGRLLSREEDMINVKIKMVFDDEENTTIIPVSGEDCSFQNPPRRLFLQDASPSAFHERIRLNEATFGLRLAPGAIHDRLKVQFKNKRFKFVVSTTNPLLCGLPGFSPRESLPFKTRTSMSPLFKVGDQHQRGHYTGSPPKLVDTGRVKRATSSRQR